MDNPIKYSDLIQDDGAIQALMDSLDALMAKFVSAKQLIQTQAGELAAKMQTLSGATDDQRQAITLLTTESDKLAKAYEETNVEERKVYRQRQEIIQAVKEEQTVDKLLVQINNSVEGSYNRLSAQYRLNKIRLNEMSAEQRRTAGVGKELEQETRAIYEEMSRLQQATGKYTLEVGHYQNALMGLPGPINQVVRGFSNMRTNLSTISNSSLPIAQKAVQGFTTVLSGTIGMIAIFVRYLTGSAKTMREFEQANADLSTILGVNVKDMTALTDSALALGRTTEYTARQVTGLQTELAKLGFGQGSIINMQKYVLQFATAVGANLSDAAQVAGSAIRAFNLTSADTEDVLATLAVATNNSALNFEKIKTSIGTVFPVANAFGLTLKDTTALLGALANAGFDASQAATATRNIILKLADSNGKLAQRLGGSVKTFDQMMSAMIKLRDSGVDLNEELALTDRRSVSAFSAFLSGAESAKELRDSLQDVSGELDRIQRERLDTVEGSTKLLKSAWEGLTLAFRESNGAIKETIDWLTKLIGKVQALLFPTETATQKFADTYSEIFNNVAKESYEKALQYADDTVAMLQKKVDEANAKVASTPAIFANRVAKAAKEAEDAESNLVGALKAQAILQQQAADAEAEQARIRQQAADEEAERQKELTKEEKKRIEAAKKQRLADLRAVIEAINLEISTTEAGTEKMLELRLDKVEAERRLELEQNRQKVTSERQDEAAINAKYDKAALDARTQFNNEVSKLTIQRLQAEQQAIQLEISITEDGTDRMLQLRLENIEKQRQIEIEQNKQKDIKLRQDEAAINAKYDKMRLRETADFNNKIAQRDLAALQDYQQAEFDLLDRNERQKTIFRLQQEKARLLAVLELDKTASKKMTQQEIDAIKETIKAIEKEMGRVKYNNLYELFGIGLDSQQQDALNTAIDGIKDSISSIIDSWNAAADAAVNAANAQVDAAQRALDAENEARNAGYANEVQTAQKELDLAKKNQAEAIKEKEKAQRAQLTIDSITQASSLVTASANIWSSLSGIPVVGPAWAIAAITAMWGSFAAAKIRAAQVSGQTEQYGDGTVELLQGGSHASGNDIDLGTKPDGTRRRAEGGEYFAVINKRNSRRYRNVIPDVIQSFNNGTFADRYQRANAAMAGYAVGMVGGGNTDISGIERDVSAIRKQGDETRFVDGNGNTIIKYKNLTRKIKS